MRRQVLLSSLAVGRCFTLPAAVGATTEETQRGSRRADSILSPEDAWRITDADDGEVQAVSASGETKAFSPDQKVVEVPREGWDKLSARASAGPG